MLAMKLKHFSLLASLVAVVGLGACREDPTEAGTGEPEAIVSTRSESHAAKSAAFSITAFTVDKNLKRIAGPLTATSAGTAVTVDSAVYFPELAETRVFLRTGTAASTGTIVTLSGHGLTKDVKVVVS
jgi:hypothetical protein